MIHTLRLHLAAVAFCVLATATSYAYAETSDPYAVNFGTGGNTFTMEFVPIGNLGNAADTTGNPRPAGSVDYLYSMGKFEISRDMITNYNNSFGAANSLSITLEGMGFMTGGPRGAMPATGVSWNEAARFVNWLNTSTGGMPAYKFTTSAVNDDIALWTSEDAGFDASNPFRNSLATYVLPSMDEWYKAAYYDPTRNIYGDYPSSDGTAPSAVAAGSADLTAVFGQPFSQGPADITQAGGLSAYGIMGLGGNVGEWLETEFDLVNDSTSGRRSFRGNSWEGPQGGGASSRGAGPTTSEISNVGFRVVRIGSVPEPSSFTMFGIAMLGMSIHRRRKTN